jgi:hypothetical protein
MRAILLWLSACCARCALPPYYGQVLASAVGFQVARALACRESSG